MNHKHLGFSLIELLFALIILSICLSFAIPNYRHMLVKTRRLEAKTSLLELANQLESYYSANLSYKDFKFDRKLKWYELKISQLDDSSFNLEAVPKGPQAFDDKTCQTFSLNSFADKNIISGPSGAPEGRISDCW